MHSYLGLFPRMGMYKARTILLFHASFRSESQHLAQVIIMGTV